MTELIVSLIMFVGLIAALATGLWVGLAMLSVSLLVLAFLTPVPVGSVLATTIWDFSWNWGLAALPLFVWMGEILFRTRLSEDMLSSLAPWLNRLPGRLLHVNVVGCTILAAAVGSSAVCSATIGRMTIPELRKQGYDERMAIGTLAGAGTLGLLIPPSVMMIVYGIVANVSISRLFMAGFIPGFTLAFLFSSYIVVWAWFNPDKIPEAKISMTFREKVRNSRRLIPLLLLIFAVLGSIYAGLATPTEAGVFGVLGSLGIAAISGTLSIANFWESLLAATRTSCTFMFILVCAAFFSIVMAFTGIPQVLANHVQALQLSSFWLLFNLSTLYIFLGCFLDGISMIVLTAAVVLPLVQAHQIDLLWFGIFIIVHIEIAQITPPVGFNIYVLQALTGRDMMLVSKAALPFFMIMLIFVIMLGWFPQLVTFLPSLLLEG